MSDLCNWIVLVCSFSSRQGVSIRPRCLGVPRVHQDTHGYQLNLVSKAFSLRKWEGWERPCHWPVDSSLRLSFSHHPFPFSKGQNPGNELGLLETDPITVKPLLSRHLRDLPKCPLNRGCPPNWGL